MLAVFNRVTFVQLSVLITNFITITVRQTIMMVENLTVVVSISFPPIAALLKLLDDLGWVLMLMILFIEVVLDVVWDLTLGHETGRYLSKISITGNYSSNYRIWLNEWVFC